MLFKVEHRKDAEACTETFIIFNDKSDMLVTMDIKYYTFSEASYKVALAKKTDFESLEHNRTISGFTHRFLEISEPAPIAQRSENQFISIRVKEPDADPKVLNQGIAISANAKTGTLTSSWAGYREFAPRVLFGPSYWTIPSTSA